MKRPAISGGPFCILPGLRHTERMPGRRLYTLYAGEDSARRESTPATVC